ncbi:MAG: hypothetical protein ACERKV_05260 [Clostridiaceae bacterium]
MKIKNKLILFSICVILLINLISNIKLYNEINMSKNKDVICNDARIKKFGIYDSITQLNNNFVIENIQLNKDIIVVNTSYNGEIGDLLYQIDSLMEKENFISINRIKINAKEDKIQGDFVFDFLNTK